jgi:hypothetical protein
MLRLGTSVKVVVKVLDNLSKMLKEKGMMAYTYFRTKFRTPILDGLMQERVRKSSGVRPKVSRKA